MSTEPTSSTDAASGSVTPNRRLYLAGFVGPVLFWLIVFILGFLTPGYSRVHDAISDLGAIGAPYAVVQQANFVIVGLGVLAFVVAVDRQFRDGNWPWIGVILIGVFGLFGGIGSAIPVNPAEGAQLSDQLHAISGIVGFHAGLIGIPLTSRRLAKEGGWPAYHSRMAVLAITAVIVASYVVFLGVGIGIDGYGGLAQRQFALAITGWVAVHAYVLYKQ